LDKVAAKEILTYLVQGGRRDGLRGSSGSSGVAESGSDGVSAGNVKEEGEGGCGEAEVKEKKEEENRGKGKAAKIKKQKK